MIAVVQTLATYIPVTSAQPSVAISTDELAFDIACPGSNATTFFLTVDIEDGAIATEVFRGASRGSIASQNWFFLPEEATERNVTNSTIGCPRPIVEFTALREGTLFIEDETNYPGNVSNRVVGSSVISASVRSVERLEFNRSSAGVLFSLNKTLVSLGGSAYSFREQTIAYKMQCRHVEDRS